MSNLRAILCGGPFVLLFSVSLYSQAEVCENLTHNLPCQQQALKLVDTEIKVRIYRKTKPGKAIDRTFVVVHANEKKGLAAAKEVISQNFGRLVEIVTNAPEERNGRYLYFGTGKANCIDPNRIYTAAGIRKTLADTRNPCQPIPNPSDDLVAKIGAFANKFLQVVTNANTHRLIIGVHNNNPEGLNLEWWSANGPEAKSAFGIFLPNDHTGPGSTLATNTRNLVLVTNGNLFGQFLTNHIFSLALQEDRNYLMDARTGRVKDELDDGSMSIYFGTTLFAKSGKPFSYVNIEAGGKADPPATGNSPEWEYEMSAKRWQMDVIRKIIFSITP